ncbi:hypothetical protein V8E55_012206 [Tylopilus felleus]
MALYDTTIAIGPLLVGIFFNTFLYGLVTYQFAVYYWTTTSLSSYSFDEDFRYMVLFLFVLDTFHTLSSVTDYQYPAALAGTIWRLTSSKILYGVVILLAIPSFILGTIVSIKASIIKVLSEFPWFTPIAVAWLSTQLAVDIFITTTLVIIFSRSRTGFHKTDTILNRLIRCAVQTGLFSGFFSLGNLITFVIFPDTDLYVMFAIPLGRIYTNTLLDILLTRQLLKEEHSTRNVSIMVSRSGVVV